MPQKLQPLNISVTNKVMRIVWRIVWLLLYRPTPRFLHPWRRFLLRVFGAKIGKSVHIFPSVKVWAPWNLRIGDNSGIADYADVYSVDIIHIGRNVSISQYSFLCTASHDYTMTDMPTISAPIHIEDYAWITSGVFVAPGVTVREGGVALARAVVLKDIGAWTVVAGNPAKFIKDRVLAK